jgi:hypothetical protein
MPIGDPAGMSAARKPLDRRSGPVGVPTNTPTEVIERLNKEINAGLANPKIKARLANLGGKRARALARRFWKADCRQNREVEVIRAANIKPE